jgi:hypothetical protein
MQKMGVRPEFEIFEAGQMDNALKLVKKHGPAGPLLHWDFVLGVPGSMSGEPRNLMFLVDRIPEGSTWTCTGIGRWHMPVTMTALALGGNVRLGFEDNFLHMRQGERRLSARRADRAGGAPCATPARRGSSGWGVRRAGIAGGRHRRPPVRLRHGRMSPQAMPLPKRIHVGKANAAVPRAFPRA